MLVKLITRTIKLFFMNALLWGMLHLLVSFFMFKVKDKHYKDTPLDLRSYPFENEGMFWEKLTRVKRWKDQLPEGSTFFKSSYDKSMLQDHTRKTIDKFYIETNRAELTHWITMLLTPIVLIFNPRWTYGIHIMYAILSNLPFIIIQRYNRPRFKKILKRYEAHADKKVRDNS